MAVPETAALASSGRLRGPVNMEPNKCLLRPAGGDAAETDPFELLTAERFKYVAPEWR